MRPPDLPANPISFVSDLSVVGRRVFPVKVCAAPKRERAVEEENLVPISRISISDEKFSDTFLSQKRKSDEKFQ
jgi:hypothetical protein